MQDVVVYGSHRVGKRKSDLNQAIVCTMLDARKRGIVLDNAKFYLKDTQIYVSEDRMPTQQAERRHAYEERMKKKKTHIDA
eukprot:c37579_g1_i1 orf=347-589(+)